MDENESQLGKAKQTFLKVTEFLVPPLPKFQTAILKATGARKTNHRRNQNETADPGKTGFPQGAKRPVAWPGADEKPAVIHNNHDLQPNNQSWRIAGIRRPVPKPSETGNWRQVLAATAGQSPGFG